MVNINITDADQEALGLPAEEKWGFRLTGGSEFDMPITVFQVSSILNKKIFLFSLSLLFQIYL